MSEPELHCKPESEERGANQQSILETAVPPRHRDQNPAASEHHHHRKDIPRDDQDRRLLDKPFQTGLVDSIVRRSHKGHDKQCQYGKGNRTVHDRLGVECLESRVGDEDAGSVGVCPVGVRPVAARL